jgi:hypothetical protein
MTAQELRLAINLGVGPEDDGTEADRSARLLRSELLQLDVVSADLAPATAEPEGAKGFGLAAIGSLLVNLTALPVLRAVADVVVAWIGRDDNRSAKLVIAGESIEITGISAQQQERLIDDWIARVAEKSDARK